MIYLILACVFVAIIMLAIQSYLQNKELESQLQDFKRIEQQVDALRQQFEAKRTADNRRAVAKLTPSKKSSGVIAAAKKVS